MAAQLLQDLGQGGLQGVGSGLIVGLEPLQGLGAHIRCGDEVLAHLLGHGTDQVGDQLGAQARDQPGEAVGLQLVQEEHRDPDGDAVGAGAAGGVAAGVELVAQLQSQTVVVEVLREGLDVHLLGRIGQQVLLSQVQQLRGLVALLLPPGVEVALGDDRGGQTGVEEGEELLIGGAQILASRAVLQLLDLLEALPVPAIEVMAGVPVSLDQGALDEQLAAVDGIHLGVEDLAVSDHRDAEERDLLGGHHSALAVAPARLRIGGLGQMRGQLFDPGRIHPSHHPGPEPGSLHQLGRHHPVMVLLEQPGAGEDGEPGAAGTLIVTVLGRVQADMAQQPGEQRLVDRIAVGGRVLGQGGGLPPLGQIPELGIAGDLGQLDHQILPFADAQIVQVLPAAELAELIAGELLLLQLQIAPQVQQRGEVAGVIGEAAVQLIGLGPLLSGTLAGILDGQGGHQHGDLLQAAAAAGLDHHPAQPRVGRQTGEQPTGGGDRAGLLQGAQLGEQPDGVVNGLGVGLLDEGELQQLPRRAGDAHGRHLQQHAGQRGAQNLRIGELRPGGEVLLGVEPDGHTGRGASGTAGALIRRSLGDRLDGQPLHLGSGGVPRDAGGAGVDHVFDARHGQRGLCHIGGQHDPAST